MSTDIDLLLRCAQEDPLALRELISGYEPRLRVLLTRLLVNAEDVEDVLCSVFLRLWRTAPGFQGKCAVSTWIYRIGVSAATDVLRRQRSMVRVVALEEGETAVAPTACEPEPVLLANERDARYKALTRAALSCLTPEERIAITLHYLETYSYKEVAEMTDARLTTVRMRLFRARNKMQAYLRIRMDDDEIAYLDSTSGSPGPLSIAAADLPF